MSIQEPQQEWNDWLDRHASRLLLFARQQTGCAHDAEDVLQEALVESWRRAGGRPELPLVFKTIRRRAIDLGRSKRRRADRESRQEMPELFTITPGEGDTTALLEKEVSLLPAPQREVLTLKFWGGLTFAEIAEALEIPQGTAASRYRLAMESLRQTLTALI